MNPSFVRDLSRYGQRVALVVPGEGEVSYADLARRAGDVALRLRGPKRLVAIEAGPAVPAIAAYLGALAAGHAVALLPEGDDEALARFDDRFRPETVFRRVGGRWRLLTLRQAEGERLHADLALVMMTSGSTGQGKGVRISGTALAANAAAIVEYMGLTAEDRGALILPLHYAYGLSVLNAHLAAGASLWLHRGSVLDQGFLAGLRASGCTNLSGVPYSYELFDRVGLAGADLPDLRLMTVAGGALAPEQVSRWHAHMAARGGQFFVMYGQTEATARIAFLPPALAASAPGHIGIAIPGGSLSLRAADGRTVDGANTEGELVYRGPNVMMGYAAGRTDLARGAEVDALATGDLAVRDESGLYRIVGRLRRMSKIAGMRIGHDAVEASLAASGIAAAVFGDDHCLTAAFTSAHDGDEVSAAMVRATGLTARHVAACRVAALPRLPSGKIDYDHLRRQVAPAPRAIGMLGAFRQSFHPRPVGQDDSFAGLGGDSLRHVELAMDVERLLGFLPQGWERLTVADLAGQQQAPGDGGMIGTDLVIRALAILLVAIQHQTHWPVYGGSAAMVILIGYSLGRFQREILASGDIVGLMRPLGRVLVPYYLILAAYAIGWGSVPWLSVFLAGNFGFGDPVRHDMLPYLYWFVEAYAQMLAIFGAVMLVPAARRVISDDPFRFGFVLLSGAVAARVVGPEVWPLAGRQIFTLPWVFYLCALGWCIATADNRRRRLLVLAAAAVVMPGAALLGGNWFGAWIKYGAQFAVVAAMLFRPRIRLSPWVSPGILAIARASFLIYLLHRFVPELVLLPLAGLIPAPVFDALAVVGGVGLGLAGCSLQRRMRQLSAGIRPFRRKTARNAGRRAAASRGNPATSV